MSALVSSLRVAPDHPAFAGHFPGQPLLPGVLLLAEVMEFTGREPVLAALIGPAPRIANAKFLAPVRPGDTLRIVLTPGAGRLAFEVRCGDTLAASGQFETAAGR